LLSQAEDVYSTALKTDDEMFHMALYDWLLCKQMPDKLLSVSSQQISFDDNYPHYVSAVL